MSCPYTETTAVLAAFGEAPADFEAHLETCTECQAVVDAHTETLAVLGTAAPAAPRRRWGSGLAAFLLAAAALLAIQTLSPGVDPAREAIDSPVPDTHQVLATLNYSFESTLDSDLSDLELELALMTLE